MNLLSLLLVLAAAAPDKNVLLYEGPVEGGTDPSTYVFTSYAKGDMPFVAVDEANLRATATLDSDVVRTLRLGSALQVLDVSAAPVLVKDRVDRWYRVRTQDAEPKEGFVLGNVLTPLSATRDLDGDGQEESLAVGFTSDFMVRVRVVEPELAARGKRAVAALDFLLPDGAAGRRGGRARLVPVSAEDLGMEPPARAFGLELCAASCVVHAVTYEARTGAVGSLSVPAEVRAGVTLYPKPKTLLSLLISGDEDIPDDKAPCVVIGKVRGGRYDQKEVLSCLLLEVNKVVPDRQRAVFFVMTGGKQLMRMTFGRQGGPSSLDGMLKRKGYRVGLDESTVIPGLMTPDPLYADARGRVVERWSAPGSYVRSTQEVAFVHPALGAVTMTRAGAKGLKTEDPLTFNGFYVPEPGRGFHFFAYQRDLTAQALTWKQAPPKDPAYTLEVDNHCGIVKAVDPAPADVRAADLVEVGEVKGAGPVFALKEFTHPEVERAWAELREVPEFTMVPGADAYKTKEAFFAALPRLFWRDSFGRLLRVRRVDLVQQCLVEPIVYFYPERPLSVRYALAPIVRLARAQPPARDNAWTFLATPEGALEHLDAAPGQARRHFRYLFWEGSSLRFPAPARGVCLPTGHTEGYLREVLPRLGLVSHETEDFLAAWEPLLKGAAFHVLGFHPPEWVEALAPVEISPRPTHLIRILLDATPVEQCPPLEPPVLPDEVPARGGFTVVEWGGVLRPRR